MVRALLAFVAALVATPALANWSLNLGYQNPAVSTFGVNFLYHGSNWHFETGIGWIDADASVDEDDDDDTSGSDDKDKDDDKDTAGLSLAGDVDLKYLFSSGGLRPFIQAGFGIGVGARAGDGAGFGAGTGGGFFGGGLFLGSPSFYGYGSYNLGGGGGDGFVQAGIGFDI